MPITRTHACEQTNLRLHLDRKNHQLIFKIFQKVYSYNLSHIERQFCVSFFSGTEKYIPQIFVFTVSAIWYIIDVNMVADNRASS